MFDGHGGNQVAEFVRDNFVKELTANANFKDENYEEALKETFVRMDELLKGDDADAKLQKYTQKEEEGTGFNAYSGMEATEEIALTCGCTACVCLVTDDKIYCANAGDSRCVLSQKGEAVAMSFDHKPSNHDEETRIK